jgi:signal transduction histidine kinase
MKWKLRLNLTQRLVLVSTVLLMACCGTLSWLQLYQSRNSAQELTQRLSYKLAQHIAAHSELIGPQGVSPDGLNRLLDMLMVVNPSIEVYLLQSDGHIAAHLAPAGRVKLERVQLAPVMRYLDGAELPILGEDPRHPERPNVFSVAPLKQGEATVGYVYVILLGEDHEALAATGDAHRAWVTMAASLAMVLSFGVLAGLAAFSWVTRPLRQLTQSVQTLERDGVGRFEQQVDADTLAGDADAADEIRQLRGAFQRMGIRLAQQWQELLNKDQQRRELVANISHDLRTPLMALHGYLETLALKEDRLPAEDRRRYLSTALAQSRKVGQLAQELFELARLEYGGIRLDKERFHLTDLIQDVFQKFELSAQTKGVRLEADIAKDLPSIVADVGLMERVLTNLIDNALRHSPREGLVRVAMSAQHEHIVVTVSDQGEGVAPALRQELFDRPSVFSTSGANQRGGLGLLIEQRIVQLHDGVVELMASQGDTGATFRFALPV